MAQPGYFLTTAACLFLQKQMDLKNPMLVAIAESMYKYYYGSQQFAADQEMSDDGCFVDYWLIFSLVIVLCNGNYS